MIIAAAFFGASLSLFCLVLIFDEKSAKHQNKGIVLQFPKRGGFVDFET